MGVAISDAVVKVAVEEAKRLGWTPCLTSRKQLAYESMRLVLEAAQEQAAEERSSFDVEDWPDAYRRAWSRAEELAQERDALQRMLDTGKAAHTSAITEVRDLRARLARAKTLLAEADARWEDSAISPTDAEKAYIQVRHLVNLLEGAGWIKAVQAFEALKRIVNTHSSQEGEQ